MILVSILGSNNYASGTIRKFSRRQDELFVKREIFTTLMGETSQ